MREWPPALSVDSVIDAVPLVMVAVPMFWAPSKKVTEPLGVPARLAKVPVAGRGVPDVEGCRLLPRGGRVGAQSRTQ